MNGSLVFQPLLDEYYPRHQNWKNSETWPSSLQLTVKTLKKSCLGNDPASFWVKLCKFSRFFPSRNFFHVPLVNTILKGGPVGLVLSSNLYSNSYKWPFNKGPPCRNMLTSPVNWHYWNGWKFEGRCGSLFWCSSQLCWITRVHHTSEVLEKTIPDLYSMVVSGSPKRW